MLGSMSEEERPKKGEYTWGDLLLFVAPLFLAIAIVISGGSQDEAESRMHRLTAILFVVSIVILVRRVRNRERDC